MFGDRAKEVREAGAEHGVRGKMFPQCRLEILHAGLGRLDADRAQRAGAPLELEEGVHAGEHLGDIRRQGKGDARAEQSCPAGNALGRADKFHRTPRRHAVVTRAVLAVNRSHVSIDAEFVKERNKPCAKLGKDVSMSNCSTAVLGRDDVEHEPAGIQNDRSSSGGSNVGFKTENGCLGHRFGKSLETCFAARKCNGGRRTVQTNDSTEVVVVGNKLEQPLRGLEARARVKATITLSGETGNECRTHDSVVFRSEVDHVARETVKGLLQALTQRGVGVNVGDEVVDGGALTRSESEFGQQF